MVCLEQYLLSGDVVNEYVLDVNCCFVDNFFLLGIND